MHDPVLSRIQMLKAKSLSQEQQQSINCLSYQQFNHLAMTTITPEAALQHSHLGSPGSKIVETILEDSSIFNNSLWSHSPAVLDLLKMTSSPIHITHSYYSSQSILLAIYASHLGHKTSLYASKQQITKGWTSCAVPLREIDKVSAVRSLIKSQKIDFNELEKMHEASEEPEGEGKIEIWDIFNTHPTIYRPFLFKRLQRAKKQKKQNENKVLIYGSEAQQRQIQDFIAECDIQVEVLQACQRYPYEIVHTGKIEDELTKFLNQESSHPNKQDIVIFADPTPAFIKKLMQALKKSDPEFLKFCNFITGPNQSQKMIIPQANSVNKSSLSTTSTNHIVSSRTHNNIFVAPNFDTLVSWSYQYEKVFYVFDYRKDKKFGFNYTTMIYEQASFEYISQNELAARLSLIGVNNLGKYCSESIDNVEEIKDSSKGFLQICQENADIGRYLLQMINYGCDGKDSILQKEMEASKKLKSCYQALVEAKIIEKDAETLKNKILNTNILRYVWEIDGLNPFLCAQILFLKENKEKKDSIKLINLLAMATSILMTPGNMRKVPAQSNGANDRPSHLWRQTGYLHSCIDAIVRTKIIQQKEEEKNERRQSRIESKKTITKKLSQVNSCEYDVFGTLFEIVVGNRMTFDEMKVEDLLVQQFINETVYHQVISQFDLLVQVLELEEYREFTSFTELGDIIQALSRNCESGSGVYSGSRRIGYFLKGESNPVFPSKSSLIFLLNERPAFIYVTRLSKKYSKDLTSVTEILMSNHISQEQFMEYFGTLPNHKQSSYGETQIEFHGISSATFHQLWKEQATDVAGFEKKYQCFVEPNEEVALISIHCAKQMESVVKNEFDELLNKIKTKLISETKMVNYLGTTNVVLGSGGSVIQVVKDKYISECYLSNLRLDVEVEDLHELFDQFFTLKEIKFVENLEEKERTTYKTAQISFNSQKDYYRFFQYFNQCQYLERFLKIIPIQNKTNFNILTDQMYVEVTWNAWKSNEKAYIEFQNEQAILKVEEFFKSDNNMVDGKKVKFEINKEKCSVVLDELDKHTDEYYLQKLFAVNGKIKHLQILKTPLKENLKIQQQKILEQIQAKFPNQNLNLKARKVQKLKNGLRKCEVLFRDVDKMNQTIIDLENQVGVAGVGRVHLRPWTSYPIKVPNGYIALYEELLTHCIKSMENNKIVIDHVHHNNDEYIVIRSTIKQEIDAVKEEMRKDLAGYPIDLSGLEINILLSDVGIQNLFDLQQKYNCRLLPNFNDKTLMVQVLFENLKKIKEQVKMKVNDNFFYRIPLSKKAFKNFKENPVYLGMKEQYHLNLLELEEVGKNILLEGSANNVQAAFNYLMHIIEAVVKPEEEMLNADVCGICCEEPFRPYRLQQCGHKFCLECLTSTVSSALGDMAMFPIKCPQCLELMVVEDLNSLLSAQVWPKLIGMAVNQYTGRNPDIVSGCYTAGCKQINFLLQDYFKCDACNQSYCIECKQLYHPRLTCEEAKMGGNTLFEKYMKENNIRKCPNDKCKFPIERTDGCYRVTCTRCDKSMCFKCEPEKMISYDNYNDCYKHLQDVHGGYW